MKMINKEFTSLLIVSVLEGVLLVPVILVASAIGTERAMWVITGYVFLSMAFSQSLVERKGISFLAYEINMVISGIIFGVSSLIVMFLTCEIGGRFVRFISTNRVCIPHRGLITCLIAAALYIGFTATTYKLGLFDWQK